MSDDLKQRALSGLMWSLLQSWLVKALGFVFFLVLARLLAPEQLGLASAVASVMLIISTLAEFGLGDALVQRRALRPQEVMLPFCCAMGLAMALALGGIVFSGAIERQLRAPGLAPLLIVAVLSLPLTTMSSFQVAMHRRELDFKTIAVRTSIVTLLSGLVGIGAAFAGLGSWSLIIQALSAATINAAWLWFRPRWKPSKDVDRNSFASIAQFGATILASRIIDLAGTRAVDFLVIHRYGSAALGLYAVGSQVYQTLLLTLANAVSSVSLSAFSKIAHDNERVKAAYLRTLTASAALAMPTFIGVAALAPDLAPLLFGQRWAESGPIMQVLALLGGVQCMQFMNGPVFSALGRPHYVTGLTTFKTVATVLAVGWVPTTSVVNMTIVFAAAQLVTTPLTYPLLMRTVGLGTRELVSAIAPFAVAAAVAFVASRLAHGSAPIAGLPPALKLGATGLAYTASYLALAALLGRSRFAMVLGLLRRGKRGQA